MVYGGAPFSHLRDIALKVAAISNPRHRIAFPDHAVPTGRRGEQLTEHRFKVGPDLLDTLKSCLRYDSKERATIPELLQQPFLRRSGDEATPGAPGSPFLRLGTRRGLTRFRLGQPLHRQAATRSSTISSWRPSSSASPTRCTRARSAPSSTLSTLPRSVPLPVPHLLVQRSLTVLDYVQGLMKQVRDVQDTLRS